MTTNLLTSPLPQLSVVSTIYYTGDCLIEFCERIIHCIETIGLSYEIILVDDGSPDNGVDIVHQLQKQYNSIRFIQLSRNFGHHLALLTGIEYATGEYVFIIDSDLEEAPENLKILWDACCHHPEYAAWHGVQKQRKGKWIERLGGALFYWIFNHLSDTPIPKNFMTSRLMRASYAHALNRFQERVVNFSVLMGLAGFKQLPVVLEKKSLHPSQYNFHKRFDTAIRAITAATAKPLWSIFYLGLGITCLSMIGGLWILFRTLIGSAPVTGLTPFMILLSFFSGLVILTQGIIAIYIAHIMIEVKERPRVIIEKIDEKKK